MTNNPCTSCGSQSFDLIDGFYFCTVCSTQSLNQRELGDQETQVTDPSQLASLTTLKIGQKKGRKTRKSAGDLIKDEKLQNQLESNFTLKSDGLVKSDNIITTYPPTTSVNQIAAIPYKKLSYPEYLGQAGYRIATFTQLLRHHCTIAIDSYGIPESLRDHVFQIWRLYLCWQKVAFFPGEIIPTDCRDEERMFHGIESVRKMKKSNEQESAEKSKSRKSGSIMNEMKRENENEAKKEDTTKLKETRLDIDTVKNARKIFLRIDLIEAMLYLGCLSSGANWVLLSDITRWFREGRFPISESQKHALSPCTAEESGHSGRSNNGDHLIFPLSEHLRIVVMLCLQTSLPQHPISFDMNRLMYRLIWSLNLPREFLHRTDRLLKLFPPKSELDLDWIKSTFEMTPDRSLFKDFNERFISEGNARMCNKKDAARSILRFFSPETKAAALLLLALKMIFGLDDERERKLSEYNRKMNELCRTVDGNREWLFVYSDWVLQTRLRLVSWKGTPIHSVLSPDFVSRPFPWSFELCCKGRNLGLDMEFCFSTGFRRQGFSGCLPNHHSMPPMNRSFHDIFLEESPDFMPDSKQVDALIAPLRFQANKNQKLKDNAVNDNDFDQKNLDLFFRDFSTDSLNYFNSNKLAEGGEPNKKKSKIETNSINALFPCASQYNRYRLPSMSNELHHWEMKNFKHRLISLSKDTSPLDPYSSNLGLDTLLRVGKRDFSASFHWLLTLISLLIGEEPSSIYFLLILLEWRLFSTKIIQPIPIADVVHKKFNSFYLDDLLPLLFDKYW